MAYERVNPNHPDKCADRIAGAFVDYCYAHQDKPRCAWEVLIGHGLTAIIGETSVMIPYGVAVNIVERIIGQQEQIILHQFPQDIHLAFNQMSGVKCGDNGLFKGMQPTREQKHLTDIAAGIYERWQYDGKYIIQEENGRDNEGQEITNVDNHKDGQRRLSQADECDIQRNERADEVMGGYSVTVCQSHLSREEEPELRVLLHDHYGIGNVKINPLGEWTGGPDTDSGATNRKLGSDMGDALTGGGLHGKDLSKGDVSINIVCHLKAIASGEVVSAACSIGDENVLFQYADGKTETMPFADVVETAAEYIEDCGGFEKFSEWGLIRPVV